MYRNGAVFAFLALAAASLVLAGNQGAPGPLMLEPISAEAMPGGRFRASIIRVTLQIKYLLLPTMLCELIGWHDRCILSCCSAEKAKTARAHCAKSSNSLG